MPTINPDIPEYARQAMEYVDRQHRVLDNLMKTADAMEPVLRSMDAVDRTIRQMAATNNVSAILSRQEETFAAIAASFRVPTSRELQNTQARLHEFVLDTPKQVEQVEEAIARIPDDSKTQTLVNRLTNFLTGLHVPGVKPETLLLVLAFLICYVLPPADIGPTALFYAVARDIIRDDSPDE